MPCVLDDDDIEFTCWTSARCMASRARTLRRNSTAKAAPARPPGLSVAQNLGPCAAWRRTSPSSFTARAVLASMAVGCFAES